MSFSTARIVQEVRDKYRSDELEAKRHEEQRERKAKAAIAAAKKKKTKTKADKVKKKSDETSSRDSVVSDSEPERIADEQREAEENKREENASTFAKNGADDAQTVSTDSSSVRELVTPDAQLGLEGSPDIEIFAADLDVEYIGAQKLNLNQYRYKKPATTSGPSAVAIARAVTSRSGLADQATRLKSGMPSPGSMDKFLTATTPAQPEASTSTLPAVEGEIASGGKKTMSKGNGRVKKERLKKEKVELPDYPVSEVLMRELDGCVVCGSAWPPRQMLKTKWVGLSCVGLELGKAAI